MPTPSWHYFPSSLPHSTLGLSYSHMWCFLLCWPVSTCVWCLTPVCPDTTFDHRPGLAATPSTVPVPTHTGLRFPTPSRTLVINGVCPLCRAQARANPSSLSPSHLFEVHKKAKLGGLIPSERQWFSLSACLPSPSVGVLWPPCFLWNPQTQRKHNS